MSNTMWELKNLNQYAYRIDPSNPTFEGGESTPLVDGDIIQLEKSNGKIYGL
ncbi:MAG: hypothetical protein LBI13_08430 [Streptococcaceae bacterium]|jgi:hypothetical protein|nr:hypothetical protein [Streptococcaceae bacterium]